MVHSWDAVFSMAAFVGAPLAEAKTIISVTLVFEHVNETLDHPDFFGAIPAYTFPNNYAVGHFGDVRKRIRCIIPEALLTHFEFEVVQVASAVSAWGIVSPVVEDGTSETHLVVEADASCVSAA